MTETIRFTIQLFCIATMFAMGLGVSLADIRAPFRNLLALALIVAVNNILVPLLGFFIVVMPSLLQGGFFGDLAKEIVPLSQGQQVGFLLLLLASGSLLGPLLARVSGATADFARGIMVVLVGATALIMPFQLELIAQQPTIFKNLSISVESGEVFMTLLIYQLLPLAVGLLINMQSALLARLLRPLLLQLTGISFLVLLAMIAISGEAAISLPGKAPGVRTEVNTTAVVTPTNDLASVDILTEVKAMPNVDEFPENASAQGLADDAWVVFNAHSTYFVEHISPTLNVSRTNSITVSFGISGTENEIGNRVNELDERQISSALLDDFKSIADIELSSDLVAVIEEDFEWALVNAEDTYFVVIEEDVDPGGSLLIVYQELPEPQGIISEFLSLLEGLPVIGPIVDFLTKLVVILLPYALLIAVGALLLASGRLTGVAVRNIVKAEGPDIPATLATSTAVRNVSMALIIIANHFLNELDHNGLAAIGTTALAMVMVFYVINLIVAARQAAKWGSGEEAVEAAEAESGKQ